MRASMNDNEVFDQAVNAFGRNIENVFFDFLTK